MQVANSGEAAFPAKLTNLFNLGLSYIFIYVSDSGKGWWGSIDSNLSEFQRDVQTLEVELNGFSYVVPAYLVFIWVVII